MGRPTGADIDLFSRHQLWTQIVCASAPQKINALLGFETFLVAQGYPKIISFEYATRNLNLVIEKIIDVCNEWDALGVPRPAELVHNSNLVTWAHPKFLDISGRNPLPADFIIIWQVVVKSLERDFLFWSAAFLYDTGCDRIFITDTSGDGGVDVLGVIGEGALRGLALLMQSKTAQSEVGRDSLLCDYSKYLLLRHSDRWRDYKSAMNVDKSLDGLGVLYVFASNQEFKPNIRDSARDLPVVLRSGRQLAHRLALRAPLEKWLAIKNSLGDFKANLSRNLVPFFAAHIKR
jgi:hypothetical protein